LAAKSRLLTSLLLGVSLFPAFARVCDFRFISSDLEREACKTIFHPNMCEIINGKSLSSSLNTHAPFEKKKPRGQRVEKRAFSRARVFSLAQSLFQITRSHGNNNV